MVQKIHIQTFLSRDGDSIIEMKIVKDELNKINERPFSFENLSGNLKDLLVSYDTHMEETLNGVHGSTAQYG